MSRKKAEIFIDDSGHEDITKALELLEENMTHLAQSCFDDFAHENAEAAADVGCEAVLIRKQLWNCCEWCADLAGKYNYTKREYPPDVFKRHKSCRCIVTVEWKQGGVQDVWSKKKFRTREEAEAERRREIIEEYDEEFKALIRQAKDRGEHFIDATFYYKARPRMGKADIKKASDKVITIDGETFVNGENATILFDIKPNEYRVAGVLSNLFDGEILLMPEIKKPKNRKMPDYLINGIKNDLKTLKTWREDNDSVINIVTKKTGQANRMTVDISMFSEHREDALENARSCFWRRKSNFVEQLIIVDGDEVIAVYDRI